MPNVVSNTGPILALAHLNQFDLLRQLFGKVFIPPAVLAEVKDETSLAVAGEAIAATWLVIQAAQDRLAVQLLTESLDAGESEAIVLAKELTADLVLIDERAAARKARTLGLSVVGTLGVLLLSKRAGHLETIKPSIESLLNLDFRMSTELYEQVLREAGEGG